MSKKEKLLQSAQKNIQKGQLAKAVKDFQKVLDLDPKDMRSRQRLAELCNRLNRNEEALEAYELVAKNYADTGFYLKAIAVYKQMQKIAPEQPTVYRRLADLNEKQGLIGNALGEYRTLATLYENGGQDPEYNEVLAKMKGLDPENISLRLRICQSYINQDLKEKVHKELQELLELLARVKNPEAVRKVQKLLASFCPDDLALKVGVADNLLASGQPQETVALLDGVDGDSAAQAQVFPVLARAFRQLGDYTRERKLYEQLLEQQADNLGWQERCVRACLDEGRGTDALDRLEVHKQAFLENGQAALLKDFYEQLQELFPADARVRQSLHLIYEHTGDGGKLFDLMSDDETDAADGDDASPKAVPAQETKEEPVPQEMDEEPEQQEVEQEPEQQEVKQEPEQQPEAWLAPEESEDLLLVVDIPQEDQSSVLSVDSSAEKEALPSPVDGPDEGEAAGAATAPASDDEAVCEDPSDVVAPQDDFDDLPEFFGQDDEELELEIELDLVEDPDDTTFAVVLEEQASEADSPVANDVATVEEAPLEPLEEEDVVEDAPLELLEEEEVVEDAPLELLEDENVRSVPESVDVGMEELLTSAPAFPTEGVDPASMPVEDNANELQAETGADELADLQKELGEVLEMDPFLMDDDLDEGGADLTSDLEEAEFYLQQEFLDEAEQKCQALLSAHPNCREAREMLDQVAEKRAQQAPAMTPESVPQTMMPDPPAEPVAPASAPSVEQRNTGQSGQKDQDRLAGNLSAFKKGLEDAVAQDDCETHYNLGIAYKEMGLLDEAMGEFAKAMGHASRYVDALTLTGMCLVEKGDFARAVAVFKQGLDQRGLTEQDRLNLYFEMGLLYVAWGRPLEALESFQRVADVDFSYREVGDQVRRLRSQLGLDNDEGPGPAGNVSGGGRVSYL